MGVLDSKPKTDLETRAQRGKHKEKRRPSRKVSNEVMKFLCMHIEQKAKEAGLDATDRCLNNARRMFEAAGEDVISGNARKGQLKWRTHVFKMRKRLKAEKEMTMVANT
jgi:hypothetical protein